MLAVLCTLNSCETIIDFNEVTSEQEKHGITLNAILAPDTTFTAIVSYSLLFDEVFYENYFPDDPNDYFKQYEITGGDDYCVDDAAITLAVNESESYLMRYDADKKAYVSDYVPCNGDKMSVKVEASGQIATATARIPAKPDYEIVDYYKYYSDYIEDDKQSEDWQSFLGRVNDTLMHVTLKIKDPGETKNYYRLMVRSVGYEGRPYYYYYYHDIFTSDNIIFYDERLSKWWRWPAYFTNVFSDELFNGEEYVVDVETRMLREDNPHVIIKLESLSEDLYEYLRSMMAYRVTDLDDYAESTYIYSNVKNGWGILGAANATKNILYWEDCKLVQDK